MAYGLPSMGELADEIKKSDIVISDPNYNSFCTEVDNLGLEMAIDAVNLLPETEELFGQLSMRRIFYILINTP